MPLIDRLLARGREVTRYPHTTVTEGGYTRDGFGDPEQIRMNIRPREAGPFKVMASGEVDPETRWAYARHGTVAEDDRIEAGTQQWRVAALQADPDRGMVRVRLLPDDR